MPHPGISLRRFCRTALAAAFLLLLLPLLGGAALAQPLNGWAPFGPGGGGVTSVAVDPADPAVVYAAAFSVYKSTDGGVTWQARLGPNHRLVAVDPSHPAIVYAGGDTLERSRDGGQSWRTVLADPPVVGSGISSLTVSSTGAVFVGNYGQVLRSTDFGRTWTTVLNDPTVDAFQSLVVDPTDPRRIYAAAGFQLWRSADGGDTWAQANPPNAGFPGFELSQLAVAPSSPATVYASLIDAASTVILRSADGGVTWSQAGSLPANVAAALLVDPRSPSRLYAAGNAGLYVSVDAGQTWALLQAGLPTPFGLPLPVLALALAPSQPDLLFAGTGGWGVARSASAGARWRIGVEPGLNAAGVRALKFNPLRPGIIYELQDDDRRIFRSTDGGGTWQPFAAEIAARGLYDLAFDPVAADTLYAAGGGGIAKSLDGGTTWTSLGGPPAGHLALLGRQTLLAGGCGLNRSVDGGHTWAAVIPCMASTTPENEERRIPIAIWTDPKDAHTAYVHFYLLRGNFVVFAQAFRSRDGGATWTQLPLPNWPTVFAVAPSDSRVLYAIETFSAPSGLVRSVDGGATWKVIDPQTGGFVIDGTLAVDAVNPFKLYLATAGGLQISRDGGQTWELDRAPLSIGQTETSQVWTDRNHPGLVWASGSFGGLYVGRFE